MDITFQKPAQRTLKTMDRANRNRIEKALNALPAGDIIPMYYEHGYRLRVGKYRIVFLYMPDKNITVQKIASRGDIYKGINC